mgnify:CR=1 FL=1|jgi:hypothetical protein
MPIRQPIDNAGVNPDINQLNASGDASSCVFQDWFIHTQNIAGMWTRKWVFEPTPSHAGQGAPSGCPAISFSYVDVSFDVETTDMVQRASYCSGAASAMDIDYLSDSTVGGFGLSGNFWTKTQGTLRRAAVAGDPANNHTLRSGNTTTSRIPGIYTLNGDLDTSSSFNSNFLKIAYTAQTLCDTFDTTLLKI